MKILYHHRTKSKDGQFVHIEELTTALRRRGHQLTIVSPDDSDDAELEAGGGLNEFLKKALPKAAYEILELAYNVIPYRKLMRAYAETRPDLFYERYNLFLLCGAWLKRRTGVPFFLEVNAPLYFERSNYGGIGLHALARWAERSVWRQADVVLPVTEELARMVRETGVPDERICIVPNAINWERFEKPVDVAAVREQLGLGNHIVVGFTGFMREWNRLERIVDIIAESQLERPLHLLIVGDGPARATVMEHARARGVEDRITILGVVAREQVARYVSAFDVAIQPNATHYSSPLKLFEYMALGRAIVAPDQSNIREVLTHERNALLFSPDDAAAYRAAVERLCTDDDLRRRLGDAAKSDLLEKDVTWDHNARRIEERLARLKSADGEPAATL